MKIEKIRYYVSRHTLASPTFTSEPAFKKFREMKQFITTVTVKTSFKRYRHKRTSDFYVIPFLHQSDRSISVCHTQPQKNENDARSGMLTSSSPHLFHPFCSVVQYTNTEVY